ncbi:NXPE family member 3-like [Mercenaria mercenaria]|uniref:NXPE family member 3-like n=1 Tax=Mercenaria mercenaria TaxID=6596 RepID=UPI00234E4702|nr:NXPE family member 3-like [Mercenaria mercenaria]
MDKQIKVMLGLCFYIVFYTLVVSLRSKLEKQETDECTKHTRRYLYCTGNRNGSLTNTDNHQIIYTQLNEVISEKEALQHKPCQDQSLAANARLSRLYYLDSPYKEYEIGDKIYVIATLFDSYGGRKLSGGDHLRARIWNQNLNASAPGVVYDHNNGSYTLIFEALWSGKSRISATISYTREAITAFYRMTSEVVSLRNIFAKYKVNNYDEDSLCHADLNHLLAHTNYKDACNFTSLNSGMPWYCGKPQNPQLRCSDWKFLKSDRPKIPSTISKCEKELLQHSSHQVIKTVLKVFVKGQKKNNRRTILQYYQPSIPCSKYNTTSLWYRKHTTGFFFKRRWHLTLCQGFKGTTFQECVRNKRLYLVGDSTTRQWYSNICERYNCTYSAERTKFEGSEMLSIRKVESHNITVINALHCQPVHIGNYFRNPKHSLISIPKRLESISSNEDAIFLFHIFAHMSTLHHENFRNKMRLIRVSIEKLLERNNKVKIFIKMPHTYTEDKGGINDFFGYVFSRIIFETFNGLYKKVIILNNRDATNSVASVPLHPDNFIVSAMVDQMLSFVC